MYIQKTRTISIQPACLIFYVLSSFVIHGHGLHLFMDTTPDGVYCGHLYCWTDKTVTNNNIQTVFGIAIYDVNKYSMSVKIASLSVFSPDICLRESEVTSINAAGNVSKYHAELILAFADTSYCVNGSFVCELEFANKKGDPEVIRETVSSMSSRNCYDIVKALKNEDTNLEMERELLKLRKQNVALKAEVSRLQKIVTTPSNKTQIQTHTGCVKGAAQKNPRETFRLWDKVSALCDTETDGGGWIIIQRRTQGNVDFYRRWIDYKNGFGLPDTDFWIGNDIIHNLTSQGYTELRIDMEYQVVRHYAHYSHFDITDETSNYRLSVSGFSGTEGDALSYHNGKEFYTYDKNYPGESMNCASTYYGAWWYLRGGCNNYCNLNGIWTAPYTTCLLRHHIQNYLSFSEMKIRHV